jgi:short subunit dehydrogenase-like uncharacterized protein
MLLVYGASGFTGQLIVEECVRRGIRPILGGRNAKTLQPVAQRFGLEMRVAPLLANIVPGTPRLTPPGTLPPIPSDALLFALDDVTVVLNCAGPFFRTAGSLSQACLERGVHYLDITGEIVVFEECRHRHHAAINREVVVLPGVGFDVVPTDCLASRLAATLPGSTLLELAFAGGAGFSRGTLKTMVLSGGEGGAIRQDGNIVPVKSGWRTQRIAFRDQVREAVTIPWGDVSTAQWSTRIPNIHTYAALPSDVRRSLSFQPFIGPLLEIPRFRRYVERKIEERAAGPDASARSTARMHVWGRVTHPDGRTVEGTVETPEGYRFTAISAVEAAQRVMTAPPMPGYHTPSTAFGAHFLESLPDCDMQIGPVSAPAAKPSAPANRTATA